MSGATFTTNIIQIDASLTGRSAVSAEPGLGLPVDAAIQASSLMTADIFPGAAALEGLSAFMVSPSLVQVYSFFQRTGIPPGLTPPATALRQAMTPSRPPSYGIVAPLPPPTLVRGIRSKG